MTEQKKGKKEEQKGLEWREIPNAPQIYANVLHLGWTLDDVRISFGVMKGEKVTGKGDKSLFVEQQGAAVMTWRQAKSLSDMLNRVVGAYEEKNGEIQNPLLAEPAASDGEKQS